MKKIDSQNIFNFIASIHAKSNIPGIAIKISVGNETEEISIGISNPECGKLITSDKYLQVGCFIKYFISLLLYRMQTEGIIEEENDIIDLLDLKPASPTHVITLSNLASHTSGIRAENFEDLEIVETYSFLDIEKYLFQFMNADAVGKVFIFSHTNYVLLSLGIEKVRECEIGELLKKYIFDPLNVLLLDRSEIDASEIICGSGDMGEDRHGEQQHFSELWDRSISRKYIKLTDLHKFGSSLFCSQNNSGFNISNNYLQQLINLPPSINQSPQRIMYKGYTYGCRDYKSGVYGFASASIEGLVASTIFHQEQAITITVCINASAPNLNEYISFKILNAFFSNDIITYSENIIPNKYNGLVDKLTGIYTGPVDKNIECKRVNEKYLLSFTHNPHNAYVNGFDICSFCINELNEIVLFESYIDISVAVECCELSNLISIYLNDMAFIKPINL